MPEKESNVKVPLDISTIGPGKLESVGTVMIDAPDFMAIQFDTMIVSKTAIESATQFPDKPLDEQLGARRHHRRTS